MIYSKIGVGACNKNYRAGSINGNGAGGGIKLDCALVTRDAKDVHSMTWDGDGNIYVADSNKLSPNGGARGGIYKIPSGDRNPHPLHFICDADGVWGIALLSWQIQKEASIMAFIRGLFGG